MTSPKVKFCCLSSFVQIKVSLSSDKREVELVKRVGSLFVDGLDGIEGVEGFYVGR